MLNSISGQLSTPETWRRETTSTLSVTSRLTPRLTKLPGGTMLVTKQTNQSDDRLLKPSCRVWRSTHGRETGRLFPIRAWFYKKLKKRMRGTTPARPSMLRDKWSPAPSGWTSCVSIKYKIKNVLMFDLTRS